MEVIWRMDFFREMLAADDVAMVEKNCQSVREGDLMEGY